MRFIDWFLPQLEQRLRTYQQNRRDRTYTVTHEEENKFADRTD